ncbi:MAG: hypothetical protein ACTSRE_16830 [Promethearchaeota archaeon]
MKFLKPKMLFLFLVLFISFHIFLSENGLFIKDNLHIFPLGLNPSITHDSLATRNPAIEDPLAILVDLPGGYSFYLSPILVTIPLLSDNLINGFPIPQLTGVTNPVNSFLTQLEIQRYLFLGLCGVFFFLSVIWLMRNQFKKRRKSHQ